MTSTAWPAGHPQNTEVQERARRTLTLNATNARSVEETLALLETPTVLLDSERDILVGRMTRFADDRLLTAFLARPHALPDYAAVVAKKGTPELQARLVAWVGETLPQAAEQDVALRVARVLIAENALPADSAAVECLITMLTPADPTASERGLGPAPDARASRILLGLEALPEAALLRIVALPEHDIPTWHRLAFHPNATPAVWCAILAHPGCILSAVLGAFCVPERVGDAPVRELLWRVMPDMDDPATRPTALHLLDAMGRHATGPELARILHTLAARHPARALDVLEAATPAQWASLTRRDLQPIFVHGSPTDAERGMALLDRFPRHEAAAAPRPRPTTRSRR